MSVTITARTRSLLLAFLALGGLAACGGGDGGITAPAPSTAISLRNDSNAAIVSVYFSACDQTAWGDDRLGATETITPGQTRHWTVTAGCYDVKASTSARWGYWYDRAIAQGDTLKIALSPAAND